MPKRKHNESIFNPDAVTFEQVVKMPGFVDHTNIIENIFQGPSSLKFVVAPSRFGKSVNLDTIRTFLWIEIDESGNPIRDVTKRADSIDELSGGNLKNYDLFCVPKPRCNILEEKELVLEHFGRYPITNLDFKCKFLISSLEEAVDHCINVIVDAYQEHNYLINKLSEIDKENFKYISLLPRCMKGSLADKKARVNFALHLLITLLCKHFSREVVVLVDEFGAIVSAAKFKVENKELEQISLTIMDMLGDVIKGMFSDENVAYVFLTGIETVSAMGNSFMVGFSKYQFLEDDDYLGFYGADEGEIVGLVTKLKKSRFAT